MKQYNLTYLPEDVKSTRRAVRKVQLGLPPYRFCSLQSAITDSVWAFGQFCPTFFSCKSLTMPKTKMIRVRVQWKNLYCLDFTPSMYIFSNHYVLLIPIPFRCHNALLFGILFCKCRLFPPKKTSCFALRSKLGIHFTIQLSTDNNLLI